MLILLAVDAVSLGPKIARTEEKPFLQSPPETGAFSRPVFHLG